MDTDNPFGGKIQLNPILPSNVKRMIIKDSNVIQKIKAGTDQENLE